MVSYFHLLIFGKHVMLVVGLSIGKLPFLYILGYAFFGSCVVHIDPEAVLQMTYKVCIVLSLLLRKYVAVLY
jgi:hypothetical protein